MAWRTASRNPIRTPNFPSPSTTTATDSSPQQHSALSLSDRRTLYLVNIFIGDTARFLNRFSAICEEKLADVHRRMLRLDATLTLLETKLKSIDDVEELEEHACVEVAGSSNQPTTSNSSNILSFLNAQHGHEEASSSSANVHW